MKLLPILTTLGATIIFSVTAYPAPSPSTSSPACSPTGAAGSYGPNRRSEEFPPIFHDKMEPGEKRSNDEIENGPKETPPSTSDGEWSPTWHAGSYGPERRSEGFPPIFHDKIDQEPGVKRSNDEIENSPKETPPSTSDGEWSPTWHAGSYGPERRSPQETTPVNIPYNYPPTFHKGEVDHEPKEKTSNDEIEKRSADGSNVPQLAPGGPNLADSNAAQKKAPTD